jgi:seryl-tRNA synthetase
MKITYPIINQSNEFRKTVIEQLYYLSEHINSLQIENDMLIISIDDPLCVDEAEIITSVKRIIETTEKSFRAFKETISYESENKSTYNLDPNIWLIENGDLLTHSNGTYVYTGTLAKVITGLDNFLQKLCIKFGAVEYIFPTTMPFDSLNNSGYIKSFPQHVGFISYGQKGYDGFTKLVTALDDNQVEKYLGDVKLILAPTVCHHLFQTIKLSKSTKKLIVTGSSKCHRNEDKTAYGIERLNSFNMREIIFIDEPDIVSNKLTEFSNILNDIFTKWNIYFIKMNATDPFFAGEMSNKKIYQSMLDLKNEYKFHLPYSNKWLATTSINYHRDNILYGFDINTDKLHSGCIAFGLERIALSLFSQFGTNTKEWPTNLTEDLGINL